MTLPANSVNGSSATTNPYYFNGDTGQIIRTDAYRWGGTAPKAVPGAVGIDNLIDEFSVDAEFREGLREGRQWIAEAAHPKGKSLRALRLERGLSQKELAAMLNTQQPYIARIEAGKTSPQIDTVKRLADALEVDYGDLCKILIAEAKL